MKKIKSCACVMLALIMCCGVLFTSNGAQIQAQAASTYLSPTIKNAANAIAVGQAATIVVKNRPSGKSVSWSSSSSAVKITSKSNNQCKISAKKAGSSTITAKINGKKYTCKIRVENPKLSKTSITLKKGSSTTVKISGLTSNLGLKNVTWYTSYLSCTHKSGKMTSSSQTYTVKGKKVGTSTIVFTSQTGKQLKCKVKVK